MARAAEPVTSREEQQEHPDRDAYHADPLGRRALVPRALPPLAANSGIVPAIPSALVRGLHPAARVCRGRLGLLTGALSGVGFLGCGARPVARLLGLPLAVLGREL